jgi:hypothetical protein
MPDRPASLLQLGEVRPTRCGFDESADSFLSSIDNGNSRFSFALFDFDLF